MSSVRYTIIVDGDYLWRACKDRIGIRDIMDMFISSKEIGSIYVVDRAPTDSSRTGWHWELEQNGIILDIFDASIKGRGTLAITSHLCRACLDGTNIGLMTDDNDLAHIISLIASRFRSDRCISIWTVNGMFSVNLNVIRRSCVTFKQVTLPGFKQVSLVIPRPASSHIVTVPAGGNPLPQCDSLPDIASFSSIPMFPSIQSFASTQSTSPANGSITRNNHRFPSYHPLGS
mgnify:CR=1 FL=1